MFEERRLLVEQVTGRVRWRESAIAIAMIVVLVLINQGQVGISVRLSFFNRDWFNAIQEKNAAEFWRQLLYVFTPWAFVYVAIAVIEFVVQSMLVIRWRRWLTEHYIQRWLGAHTRALAGLLTDTPAIGLLRVHQITDQSAALRLVVFVDRLYDLDVDVYLQGVDIADVFAPELLAGGYRKKYFRALSRLESLAITATV